MPNGTAQNVINVVGAAIVEGSQVLICKRLAGDYKGYWEFPGGKVETHENQIGALKREVKEELGVKIRVLHFLATGQDKNPTREICLSVYQAKFHDDLPTSSNSHSEIRWVKLSDLHMYLFPPADMHAVDVLVRSSLDIP